MLAGTLELSPAQISSIGRAEATTTVYADSTLGAPPSSYSRGTLAAVGAGIGGPLILALTLFIALYIVERRRNVKLSKQHSPRLPPYKSNPSSPEALHSYNHAKSPRWQDGKIIYDSKTHFSNLPRTDSKRNQDSKGYYDTKIQHSRRSPADVRSSPTHAKKSPTEQRGPMKRSVTAPLPLPPPPPQELRAPTPVAELDVRPNSRVPPVEF